MMLRLVSPWIRHGQSRTQWTNWFAEASNCTVRERMRASGNSRALREHAQECRSRAQSVAGLETIKRLLKLADKLDQQADRRALTT